MNTKHVMTDMYKVTYVFDITAGKILWDITITMSTVFEERIRHMTEHQYGLTAIETEWQWDKNGMNKYNISTFL